MIIDIVIDLPLVFCRGLLLYTVYGFLKWKIIRGNGLLSRFIFLSSKISRRICTNFPVFLG